MTKLLHWYVGYPSIHLSDCMQGKPLCGASAVCAQGISTHGDIIKPNRCYACVDAAVRAGYTVHRGSNGESEWFRLEEEQ